MLVVFTISESWLKPHLDTSLFEIDGYKLFRQDRKSNTGKGKRGGGLITYVNNKHASSCETLDTLGVSNENIEAHWIYIHRPNCKNVITCNLYRPPSGDLAKAIAYLDDMNVDYKNNKKMGQLPRKKCNRPRKKWAIKFSILRMRVGPSRRLLP